MKPFQQKYKKSTKEQKSCLQNISRSRNSQNWIRKPCYRRKRRWYNVSSTGICWNQAKLQRCPNWQRKSNRNEPSSAGHWACSTSHSDIIDAILNGQEPATLTLSKLRKNFPERLDQAAEDFLNGVKKSKPRLQGDGTGSPTRALNGFASRNYFSSYCWSGGFFA